MAIINKNNRDDALQTYKDDIALIFKKEECLHVYDQYKTKALSAWTLAMDKGYASKNTAYDSKGIFVCTLIVDTLDKAESIIKNRETNQVEKLDNRSVADIIYSQYETVLHNQAVAFAAVNRNK